MMKLPRLSGWLLFGSMAASAGATGTTPEAVLSDARLHLTFGEQRLVLQGGLQPSAVVAGDGTIIVQAQVPEKPFPAKRIAYGSAMGTVVSHDEGASWTRIPLVPGVNGLDMEGGAVTLRDGTILALDTFVTPGAHPNEGLGQLYISKDNWRTLEGPIEITFTLPHVQFTGSSDDGGHPHVAVRLHRRILELPNGDLLTTLYGWFEGDTATAAYMPTMRKTRTVLLRSTNHGRHWDMVSTIAADGTVGTEGFGEGVLIRVSQGKHTGRLICQMRTGRDLREAISDDDGQTWTKAQTRQYADLDAYDTKRWVEMFRGVRDHHGALIENNPVELIAAVVDPDLLELRSGVLVAAFGFRVPPRACWPRAECPLNGNYLAFSLDHGETWSQVERLTSGVLTTQYMSIEELPGTNRFYVTYDLGDWHSGRGRAIYGRTVQLAVSE